MNKGVGHLNKVIIHLTSETKTAIQQDNHHKGKHLRLFMLSALLCRPIILQGDFHEHKRHMKDTPSKVII